MNLTRTTLNFVPSVKKDTWWLYKHKWSKKSEIGNEQEEDRAEFSNLESFQDQRHKKSCFAGKILDS